MHGSGPSLAVMSCAVTMGEVINFLHLELLGNQDSWLQVTISLEGLCMVFSSAVDQTVVFTMPTANSLVSMTPTTSLGGLIC